MDRKIMERDGGEDLNPDQRFIDGPLVSRPALLTSPARARRFINKQNFTERLV